MKLNKDTKQLVKVGTILKQVNNVTYTVTSMYTVNKHIYITTECSLSYTHIYSQPISHYYGLEIIEEV